VLADGRGEANHQGYVVRGEVGVRIGDRDYVAGAGSYVFKRRGL
jgi:hypothetical protein